MPGTGVFLDQLSADERQDILSIGYPKTYTRGETIVRELESGGALIVLLSGSARVISGWGSCRPTVIAIRHTGDVIGEQAALIASRSHSATVQATERLRALVIPSHGVRALRRRMPRLHDVLLETMIARLNESDRHRRQFAETTQVRVARFMAEYAESYGSGPAGRREVRLLQTDIAGIIGASRESLARAMVLLRESGMITTGRGRITILDMPALRSLGDPHGTREPLPPDCTERG